jgi:hypothetical protein
MNTNLEERLKKDKEKLDKLKIEFETLELEKGIYHNIAKNDIFKTMLLIEEIWKQIRKQKLQVPHLLECI